MKLRISLSLKIIIIFLVFIFGAGSLIYFTVSDAIVKGSVEVTTEGLSKLIGNLAEIIKRKELLNNVEQSKNTILDLFETTVKARRMIEDLFLVYNGYVVVSINPERVGKKLGSGEDVKRQKLILRTLETGKPYGEIEARNDIIPRFTYIYPIILNGRSVGALVCKYSLEREYHAVEHARKALLLYTLVSILIYVPLMLLALNYILILPLRKLVRAARMLGDGRFNLDLNIRNKDELRTVADTFLLAAEKIRATYERYLSPQVVEELSNDPSLFSLGGIKTVATVMFVDLANFTDFSRNNSTKSIMSFLNMYLENMTEIIFRFNGTLDKYLGDGILAVFGTPRKDKDYGSNAFNAALEMLVLFDRSVDLWLKKSGAVEGFTTNIRFGLSTGEVFSGNIGYDKRMDFTVIGDPVNLASRLEKVNKRLGTRLLIDAETYKLIRSQGIDFDFEGEIGIRGYIEKVKVYGIR